MFVAGEKKTHTHASKITKKNIFDPLNVARKSQSMEEKTAVLPDV